MQTEPITRRQALMAILGGVMTLAISPTPDRIRTGVHPWPLADGGLVEGVRYFTNAFDRKPCYYAAWTDPNRTHEFVLRDWHDQNILAVAERSNTRIALNVEVWPRDWQQTKSGFAELLDGAPTEAGPNADGYMANIAEHLSKWTNATGHTVPVRLIHEFNNFKWTDSTNFKALFRRWHSILRGGDVDARLASIGQEPVRTDKRIPYNGRLRFVWSPLIRDDSVMTRTELEEWWVGDSWAGLVGPDIYPKQNDATRALQFDNLATVTDFARDHGKDMCFPEFNWAARKGTDDPAPTAEFMNWLTRHTGIVRYVCQFECWEEYVVGLPSNPRPALADMYREYYSRPAFGG